MTSSPSMEPTGATPNPKQPRMIGVRNAVILSIVSLAVGVGLGVGSNVPGATPSASSPGQAAATQLAATSEPATAAPTPSPTAERTPSPTPVPVQPIVVKGSGTQKTKPFDLPAGDFTVTITGPANGNVIGHLVPRNGDILASESLFNEIASGTYTYETQVYGLEAGSYYVDMLNDGKWTVTFAPLT